VTAVDKPDAPAVAMPHGVLRTLVLAEHPPRLWSIPGLAARLQAASAGEQHPKDLQRIDQRAQQCNG
jgi:hypothetical protein